MDASQLSAEETKTPGKTPRADFPEAYSHDEQKVEMRSPAPAPFAPLSNARAPRGAARGHPGAYAGYSGYNSGPAYNRPIDPMRVPRGTYRRRSLSEPREQGLSYQDSEGAPSTARGRRTKKKKKKKSRHARSRDASTPRRYVEDYGRHGYGYDDRGRLYYWSGSREMRDEIRRARHAAAMEYELPHGRNMRRVYSDLPPKLSGVRVAATTSSSYSQSHPYYASSSAGETSYYGRDSREEVRGNHLLMGRARHPGAPSSTSSRATMDMKINALNRQAAAGKKGPDTSQEYPEDVQYQETVVPTEYILDPLDDSHVQIADKRASDFRTVIKRGRQDVLNRKIEELEYELAAARSQLGPESLEVANTLHNIGVLLKAKKNNEGAQQRFEEALHIRRKVLGSRHPRVGDTLYNLGVLHKGMKQWNAAYAFYCSAYEVYRDYYGGAHDETIEALHQMEKMRSKANKKRKNMCTIL
uniref:Kinesin light chain n=1 Tax=Pinguiococcus pyrenoidosus TaxID=172671 RepID=A0A7R9Y9F1_9STRA